MAAEDYRRIILESLKKFMGKSKTLEDLTDKIIDRMDMYDDLRKMSIPLPEPEPDELTTLRPIPQKVVEGIKEFMAKPSATVPQLPFIDPDRNLKPQERKDLLRDWCDRSFPPKLPFNIGNQQIELDRKIANAPGDMEFVRVSYAIQGTETASFVGTDGLVQPGNSGATIQIGTDVARLDVDMFVQEILAQAKSIYGGSPKNVQPSAPPRLSSLSEAMQGAPHAATDAQAGMADINMWQSVGSAASSRFANMNEGQVRQRMNQDRQEKDGFR